MDSSTIKLILSDYWAQISFILLGLGYLIKTIISIIYKKKEINMAIFQKGKIDAIKYYLEVYSETKSIINSLPEFEIYQKNIQSKEIDNIITPMLLNLDRANNGIKIYFESKISEYFNQIAENIRQINDKLCDIYFDIKINYNTTQKGIDFLALKTKYLNENEVILEQVLQIIRKQYK